MKLFRFGNPGSEKPGVLHNEQKLDVSGFGEDFTEEFLANDGLNRLDKWLNDNISNCPQLSDQERLAPPIKKPGKIVCIGLNYKDHAAESKMELPVEPIIFFKATSSIVGPNDDLIIPKGSEKTDWEVELGVVIGKKASYVAETEAMDHVAGYVLHNDYSERAFQLERSGQWVKGKSCDTFAPLGPYVVTKEEIADINNLRLWLTVNGETKQDGNTSDLIFKIPHLVSYLSQFMTLMPGDIISTGTPAGVGLGFNPPQFIHAGDVIELGIEGLGSSRQVAKAYE
ncbi:2,4-diketo-3-deoxy-L-fuconate hydrolase [Catalinimonas alkaloidigena]|uniref:fumarylacetoacetate hydrolase family protein n=1 Tax=Catalinimonas alkaloidigena TaxID=1075417 RepID=UPI00240697EC|nr:fumarylacetoacetate hydrolase family protein [Catalinimonas alkaloidigena]MDF9795602.1 2,4-diketo-3-deoxy-L-fuconate hydrolase [Catalinimonas alkaloidigena]